MQITTSNVTKHRYELILCYGSVLILECDFRFYFNLKLNNVSVPNDKSLNLTLEVAVKTYMKILWTRIPNTVM